MFRMELSCLSQSIQEKKHIYMLTHTVREHCSHRGLLGTGDENILLRCSLDVFLRFIYYV